MRIFTVEINTHFLIEKAMSSIESVGGRLTSTTCLPLESYFLERTITCATSANASGEVKKYRAELKAKVKAEVDLFKEQQNDSQLDIQTQKELALVHYSILP